MKKISILVLAFLSVMLFINSDCEENTPPNPLATIGKEVTPDVFDNGKNLLWIDGTSTYGVMYKQGISSSMLLIQKWLDGHPDKVILSISSDSTGGYGRQTGWLIYYESRAKLGLKGKD